MQLFVLNCDFHLPEVSPQEHAPATEEPAHWREHEDNHAVTVVTLDCYVVRLFIIFRRIDTVC